MGSSPIRVAIFETTPADLAHLVERDLAKVEVAGSSPVIRSKGTSSRSAFFFFVADKGRPPAKSIRDALGFEVLSSRIVV